MAGPVVTLVDVELDGVDRADLVAFLSSNRFPFHLDPAPTPDVIETQLADGAWGGATGDHRTLWIVHDNERVGVLRLDDITDNTLLFDVRLAEDARSSGVGRAAVRAAADLVFTEYPDVDRFEGYTREDNLAMRRVFEGNGWTKEAHHRQAWPVAGDAPKASIGYAILRTEWRTGERVPLSWDDTSR